MVRDTTDPRIAVDGWTVDFDDRYGRRVVCDDDTVTIKRPRSPEASQQFEVVGRIGDDIYHTTHETMWEAYERERVLCLLADWEPTYETGDTVYVVDAGFSPCMQRGTVKSNNNKYQTIEVWFGSDPFDPWANEERIVGVQADQAVHVNPSTVELLVFNGSVDLLELTDFDGVGVGDV